MTVYIDSDLQRLSDDEILRLISGFPAQRRDKLLGCRNAMARRQGALAYQLLCRALFERWGIAGQPTFSFGEHGKPFLVGHPGVHFSLSHCRLAVACAVSSSPVGIDVETIRQPREALLRHVMSQEEVASIHAAADPALQFTRLWTRKEALLKLSGMGLAHASLPTVLSGSRAHLETTLCQGFLYSVAYWGDD